MSSTGAETPEALLEIAESLEAVSERITRYSNDSGDFACAIAARILRSLASQAGAEPPKPGFEKFDELLRESPPTEADRAWARAVLGAQAGAEPLRPLAKLRRTVETMGTQVPGYLARDEVLAFIDAALAEPQAAQTKPAPEPARLMAWWRRGEEGEFILTPHITGADAEMLKRGFEPLYAPIPMAPEPVAWISEQGLRALQQGEGESWPVYPARYVGDVITVPLYASPIPPKGADQCPTPGDCRAYGCFKTDVHPAEATNKGKEPL